MILIRLLEKQPWLGRVEEALLDLLDFCDVPKQQELLSEMIIRTTSLDDQQFSNAIENIARTVEEKWGLSPSSTWFVSSNSKSNTDSSQEVLNRLKSVTWKSNQWGRSQFLTRYKEVESKIKPDDTVVIVDDFVGTGNSMLTAVAWFQKMATDKKKNFHLKVGIVAGCKTGIKNVEDAGIEVAYSHALDKAISDYYKDKELIDAREAMTCLEDKLAVLASDGFDSYRFGYESSEAMYHRAAGNTPNNVFPVFWWKYMKGAPRKTVMNRT